MLRKALYLLSGVVSKPVTHSSALTLGKSEAERTYSSHKKRKTQIHALKPASSHYATHRKRNVLTYHPPQAPLPLPKPLLLSAATRTATNARGRGGEAGRSQGVKSAKQRSWRWCDVVSAMSHLTITSREVRRNKVASKAPPTRTQRLASEESAGYHQATSCVVARLQVHV